MKTIKNLRNATGLNKNQALVIVQCAIATVILVSDIRPALCQDEETVRVCETPVCYNYSELILNGANTSADPCDDFYEYACSTWKKEHPIPPNAYSWNEFFITQDVVKRQLLEFLEEEIKPEDNEAVKNAKQQFRICMNQTNSDLNGIALLESIIEESGGWPMILSEKEWASRAVTWLDSFIYYNQLIGAASLLNLYVDVDNKNSSRRILIIDRSSVIYGDVKLKYKAKRAEIEEYLNYVKNVAMVFARSKNVIPAEYVLLQDAKEMLKFRRALQTLKSYHRKDHDLNKRYNKFTIDELQIWYDNVTEPDQRIKIDWLDTLRRIFRNTDNISIDGTEALIIRDPSYIRDLMSLLRKIPDRVIINHMQFYFIEKYIRYTTTELKSIRANAIVSIMEFYQHQERWEQCTTSENLLILLSYVYVTRYFPESMKIIVENLIDSIRETMQQQILSSTWLDSETKEKFVEKLDVMKQVIGSIDVLRNETVILQYYSMFNMSTDVLWNIIQFKRVLQTKRLVILRKVNEKNIPGMYPIIVNALYLLYTNKIVIPAAILQFPFFSPMAPSFVHYATIGTTIGHEIGHALDTEGMQFDENANMRRWISSIALESYKNQTQCFVKQYNEYMVKELLETEGLVWINGEYSLSENIADNIGTYAAYETLKLQRKRQKNYIRLPLLQDYTDDQIYFLLYAHMWCENSSPEYMKHKNASTM
ncbi:hypothetical protein KM043_015141 [Ampulex compressa]|nr:hypothetical protein KM043_015141 [Ampulex compressa]